jgi:diaminopimelate epimerase
MKFTKIHGAGNDFIILNNMDLSLDKEQLKVIASKLCTLRTSIGADGLIAVVPATHGGDFGMWFFNNDGSEGEMCGNGARCLGRYGYENNLCGGKEKMVIETISGDVTAERISKRLYKIRLNDPSLITSDIDVTVDGIKYDCTYVELGYPGHPHAIVRLDDFDGYDEKILREIGRKIRFYPAFPKGANVTFAKLYDGGLKIRTFERGVEDFTLACGTGTGSTAAAFTQRGIFNGNNIKLEMPGGTMFVSVTNDNGRIKDIYLTGPTCYVAEGEVLDEDLVI